MHDASRDLAMLADFKDRHRVVVKLQPSIHRDRAHALRKWPALSEIRLRTADENPAGLPCGLFGFKLNRQLIQSCFAGGKTGSKTALLSE